MDDQIGPSPASSIDVERVVATGRRRTRARRWVGGLSAFGGTAVVAVGITALVLTLGSPAATPQLLGDDPSPTPTPAASASPSVGSAPIHAGETLEQTKARLAAAITDHLTADVPGVQLADGDGAGPGVAIEATGDRYTSSPVLTTSAGQAQLEFEAWAAGQLPASPSNWPTGIPAPTFFGPESCANFQSMEGEWYGGDQIGHPYVTECEESVGADGQTIVIENSLCSTQPPDEHYPDAVPCAEPVILTYIVYVTWANAKVSAWLADGTKVGGPNNPPLPAPLLTQEQMVALVSDPAVTVTA